MHEKFRVGGVAQAVIWWGGGLFNFSVTPVQTGSQELGVKSLEFRVKSLELVWTSSGLSLDNIQPAIYEGNSH